MKQFLNQYDKRWADQKIGLADFTLGQKGCATTALCEKLGDFGFTITPDVLAKDPTLYTDKDHKDGPGLIIWARVAEWLHKHYPNHTFTFKRLYGFNAPTVKEHLRPGFGVLFQVANKSHWISVDRKMLFKDDYVGRDPWGGRVCAARGDYGTIDGILLIIIT